MFQYKRHQNRFRKKYCEMFTKNKEICLLLLVVSRGNLLTKWINLITI
jgi:hypothetical protein